MEELSKTCYVEKIEEGADIRPRDKFNYSLYLDKKWYSATFKDEYIEKGDPEKIIDAALLTNLVLSPILGIKDIRASNEIDFVGGIRGLKELEKRCE